MTDLEYLKKYYKGNIEDAVKRLNNGEPVQYIVGDVDFYGNIIKVDKRVLIPRRETEELVEKTLKYLDNTNLDIVDLGTGSGCIAITLKKMLPNINMDAVDISRDAISLAIENTKLNNVDINFYLGDMLNPLNKKYDCIISNPPYISYDEEVMDIVKNNEPNIALYADNSGLYFYEEILKNCKNFLKDKFIIAFEIGYNQGDRIVNLAHKYLDNVDVKIEKDLQGFDRFCFIIRK
ncbi:MAG: peptide chain release factor N(5)-glutamine methyltransferase [bacterium]|nr:peptide chain release factor N(5)-glutamine methyltransferase [bacterium]